MKNENLYEWVFHFNPYTQNWRACKRNEYLDLFNKPESNFLISKNISTLRELIEKTDGNIDKINKLIK